MRESQIHLWCNLVKLTISFSCFLSTFRPLFCSIFTPWERRSGWRNSNGLPFKIELVKNISQIYWSDVWQDGWELVGARFHCILSWTKFCCVFKNTTTTTTTGVPPSDHRPRDHRFQRWPVVRRPFCLGKTVFWPPLHRANTGQAVIWPPL